MTTPQAPPAEPRIDEPLAARMTDYLDGALGEDDAAELDALLGDDARRTLDEAREARALLADLPRPAVPRDFLRKVQRRVRRRSGGRYFHPAVQPFGWRLPVEAFVVVAIAVMAACWFVLDAGRRAGSQPIVDENPGGVETAPLPVEPLPVEPPPVEPPPARSGARLAPVGPHGEPVAPAAIEGAPAPAAPAAIEGAPAPAADEGAPVPDR